MADLDLLQPQVKAKAKELIERCRAEGITILITSTLRTFAEQTALYAQGRTRPGAIVTNARAGYSWHNFGRAFDFVPLVNGKPDWAMSHPDIWNAVGAIGRSLGLEWGGSWSRFKDFPHFQLIGSETLAACRERCLARAKEQA